MFFFFFLDLTQFVQQHLFGGDLSLQLSRSAIHNASLNQTSFHRWGHFSVLKTNDTQLKMLVFCCWAAAPVYLFIGLLCVFNKNRNHLYSFVTLKHLVHIQHYIICCKVDLSCFVKFKNNKTKPAILTLIQWVVRGGRGESACCWISFRVRHQNISFCHVLWVDGFRFPLWGRLKPIKNSCVRICGIFLKRSYFCVCAPSCCESQW